MAVTVLLELQAQPGKEAALIDLFREILGDTRAYDGCQGVEVQQDQDQKTTILLIERWATRPHYEKYLGWRSEVGTIEAIGALVAAPPSIRYFDDTGA